MPFPQQQPGQFTRESVEALNANQVGVYGLFKHSQWVYVGKGDIRKRLLDHINGDNPLITREQPTHWVGEVTNGDPTLREKQLIAELCPSCNRRLG